MSGSLDANDGAEELVCCDLTVLAPKMQARVEAALKACKTANLDAYVYETLRSAELQELYYARGRTTIPPYRRVTNAQSNLYSWHGYGLAVDVISKSKRWSPSKDWWYMVAVIFKDEGLDWGGDWEDVDLPHFQFGSLRKTPSDLARKLYRQGGMEAVWREVGAI